MLLMGCVSTKTSYTVVVVPNLNFTEFPLADSITQNNDDTCTVPNNWIVQLDIFRIKYEALAKTYEETKELYESINKTKDATIKE